MRIDLISRDGYPDLHRHIATEPSMLRRLHPLARPPDRLALKFDAAALDSAYDILLAEKPVS